MSYVYFIQAVEPVNRVKIGKSQNYRQRLSELQVGSPVDLFLRATLKTTLSAKLEFCIHHYFREYRYRGEWFNLHSNLDAFICDLGEKSHDFWAGFNEIAPSASILPTKYKQGDKIMVNGVKGVVVGIAGSNLYKVRFTETGSIYCVKEQNMAS